jgi:hypothetical protein
MDTRIYVHSPMRLHGVVLTYAQGQVNLFTKDRMELRCLSLFSYGLDGQGSNSGRGFLRVFIPQRPDGPLWGLPSLLPI